MHVFFSISAHVGKNILLLLTLSHRLNFYYIMCHFKFLILKTSRLYARPISNIEILFAGAGGFSRWRRLTAFASHGANATCHEEETSTARRKIADSRRVVANA